MVAEEIMIITHFNLFTVRCQMWDLYQKELISEKVDIWVSFLQKAVIGGICGGFIGFFYSAFKPVN